MHILGPLWENILVGLLSSALVALFAYSHRHVRNKLLERKFPLSGRYLTKFEDEVNGITIVCSAPAEFTQKGHKIYGRTEIPNDERQWKLEGEISKQGYLYGFYYAVDPHDSGIGNFFLKISYNKQMDGLWAGFDSVNNKIASGKYSFVPVMTDYNIRNLQEEDIPKLVAISEPQLGKDYLNIDYLQKSLLQPDEYFTRVVVHKKNGVIAFSFCRTMKNNSIREYLRLSENEYPKALMCAKNIGLLGIIAVDNKFQGRGIGSALAKDCIAAFSDRDVHSLCSTAWKSPKGVNIGGILQRCGFQEIKEIQNYWAADSMTKGYHCPVCGPPPCKCAAVVYGKF
jgi:ribosomal protein S18 acetylase RimI-like enzyme